MAEPCPNPAVPRQRRAEDYNVISLSIELYMRGSRLRRSTQGSAIRPARSRCRDWPRRDARCYRLIQKMRPRNPGISRPTCWPAQDDKQASWWGSRGGETRNGRQRARLLCTSSEFSGCPAEGLTERWTSFRVQRVSPRSRSIHIVRPPMADARRQKGDLRRPSDSDGSPPAGRGAAEGECTKGWCFQAGSAAPC